MKCSVKRRWTLSGKNITPQEQDRQRDSDCMRASLYFNLAYEKG